MCRFITEGVDANWMWVTDQQTFEQAIRAIGLELEGRGIVDETFCDVVIKQEETIPSGVTDVVVPVAVIDVPCDVAKRDGVTVLHLHHPFPIQTIAGESILAEMIFIITARNEESKQTFHKLVDDLLMDDESLQALTNVQSRTGLFYLQQMNLKAFSY